MAWASGKTTLGIILRGLLHAGDMPFGLLAALLGLLLTSGGRGTGGAQQVVELPRRAAQEQAAPTEPPSTRRSRW